MAADGVIRAVFVCGTTSRARAGLGESHIGELCCSRTSAMGRAVFMPSILPLLIVRDTFGNQLEVEISRTPFSLGRQRTTTWCCWITVSRAATPASSISQKNT